MLKDKNLVKGLVDNVYPPKINTAHHCRQLYTLITTTSGSSNRQEENNVTLSTTILPHLIKKLVNFDQLTKKF